MRNVLIIGASSGIGRATAESLVANGVNVIGTFNETEGHIPGVHFEPLNVLDDEVSLEFLPEQLDGLVYCPGTIDLKPFHRIKPEQFVQDYQLQVLGFIKVLQQALPYLKQSTRASVVALSTVAVKTGFPFHSLVASSKGALEGVIRSLAAEYAPSIRVNGIAPSLTQTPLASRLLSSPEKIEANAQRHPLKSIGQPEDIAAAIEFLLDSEKSRWVSGQILHVDGGMSALKIWYMFGLFKSKKDKLFDRYNKLLNESHRLSHSNRTLADQKYAEAQQVLEEFESIKD